MTPFASDPEPEIKARLSLDAQAGPAARISRERARELVRAALSAVPAATTANAHATRKLNPAHVAVAAAVVLAFVSGAGAALWVWGKREASVTHLTENVQPAPTARVVGKPDPTPTTDASQDAVPHTSEEPSIEPPPRPQDAEPTPKPRRAEAASDDLLQRANRLRATFAFGEARRAYAQVYRLYPNTLSAYVAEVAAAALELEHLAHPEAARALFQHAVQTRPQGALSLEAWQGLAASLCALHRPREEAAALRSLLRVQPEGPAASRTRARLAELERQK